VNRQLIHRPNQSAAKISPVAVLAQGERQWVAGIVYISNLLRALALLPDKERIAICLVLPYTSQPADLRELGAGQCAARYFAFRDTDSLRQKLSAGKQSLKHGKWPRSLEGTLAREKAKVVFPVRTSFGREFPVPWIGWIPDFQHKRLPDFFSEEELRRRDKGFQEIVNDAEHIVVSSEDARGDLLRWFPTQPERVSALPFVSVLDDQWFQGEPGKIAAQFQLPEKFLIFPSQFWVHKNHRVLFEAIRMLRDKGLNDICLVSTGQTNDYRRPEYFASLQKLLDQYSLHAHVRILGLLPRDVQIQLFRRAVAVVQPSLFEGWSALVEDARTLGKPIYVSDIPVHREQQPSYAVFFHPDRPDELAELVARDWPNLKPGPDLAKEDEARSEMRRRALSFARLFLQIIQRTTAPETENVHAVR
jgi:glycosyltransferase involved in cell wall biosynthesis